MKASNKTNLKKADQIHTLSVFTSAMASIGTEVESTCTSDAA